ncbi:MAG: thiamine pyrophosphate-dependent enzyme, partial [Burkholderiaceae bacterium]|nr:thiamine pyrophosphate-dependent enzyme [Burkholderiaceae bacterium]
CRAVQPQQKNACRSVPSVPAAAARHSLFVSAIAAAVPSRLRPAADGLPAFVEFHTYRFRAHSMFDAELYRGKDEVERWKAHGPIHTFTDRLKAAGMMTEDDFAAIDRAALAEVDAAVAFAEAGTWEPVEDLTKDVLSSG